MADTGTETPTPTAAELRQAFDLLAERLEGYGDPSAAELARHLGNSYVQQADAFDKMAAMHDSLVECFSATFTPELLAQLAQPA